MAATAKAKTWESRAALAIATGGFAGYWPIGPGTAGTLVAVPLVWVCGGLPWVVQILFAGVLVAVGVWASGRAVQILKKHDAPQIVVDEVAGYFVTMLGVPVTAYWLVVGFCLFRLLDIFKPFPISELDRRVKGGWGVMADDLAAGVLGCLILQLMLRASL